MNESLSDFAAPRGRAEPTPETLQSPRCSVRAARSMRLMRGLLCVMPWAAACLAQPRFVKALFALVLTLCALAPWMRSAGAGPASSESLSLFVEWPDIWEGKPLRPLALSAVEQRFAARFPGRLARLTDGEQVLVLRDVRQPTRMLHPAADCYRGLGYRIAQAQLERDAQQGLWRCFVAERDGRATRVCERIVDAQGQVFTDASSWFWAAQLGHSYGPWRAITTARAL